MMKNATLSYNIKFFLILIFFILLGCENSEKEDFNSILSKEVSNKILEQNAYFAILDYSKEHYEMYFLYVTKIKPSDNWKGIIYLNNHTILYETNLGRTLDHNIDFLSITDQQLIKEQLLKENKFLEEGSMSNFGYLYKIFFRKNKGHTLKVLDGDSYGFLLYFLRKENLNCN